MKNIILLIVLTIFLGCSKEKNNLKKAIEGYTKASKSTDYVSMVTYIHPTIVQEMGGSEKAVNLYKNLFQILLKHGFDYKATQVTEISKIIKADSTMLSVCKFEVPVTKFGITGVMYGNLIGISNNLGKTWFFVSGEDEIKNMLSDSNPALLRELTFFEQYIQIGDYKMVSKDDNWNLAEDSTGNSKIITERYDNGNLKQQYRQINGANNEFLRDGPFIQWNEDGVIVAEGLFKKAKITATTGSTGIPKTGRIGEWIFRFDNGNLMEKQTWTNGLRVFDEGYFENGKLNYTLNYDKSTKIYPYIRYFENGQVDFKCSQKILNSDSSFNVGSCVLYYENGQKTMESNYDNNGNMNGNLIRWYENGVKKMEGYYTNNIGKCITWNEDGSKQSEGKFNELEPTDDVIYYNEDGTTYKKSNNSDNSPTQSEVNDE